MTIATVFLLAGLGIVALCLGLCAAIVLRRALRHRRARHDRVLVEPYRPQLVQLVVDEPSPALAATQLASVDARTWRALEPVVVGMVRKVRGDARASLVALLVRRGTVVRLRQATHQWSAVRRAHAAELLGLLGDPSARRDLERLLSGDRDPEVRIVAARALGELGDRDAAPALLDAVADQKRGVPLRIAARSLARLGAGATGTLVEGLDRESAVARAVCAEILGLLGSVAGAVALERVLVDDDTLDVRIRAARALGRIGMPESVPALTAATADDQPAPLRAVGARALGDVGGPDAVAALEPLVGDAQHRVSGNAAESLARLGGPALAALRELALAEDERVAAAAREALALHTLRSRSSEVRAS